MSIIDTDCRTLNAYGFTAESTGELYLRPRKLGSTTIKGQRLTGSIGLYSKRVRALIERLRAGDDVDAAIAHAKAVHVPDQRFA